MGTVAHGVPAQKAGTGMHIRRSGSRLGTSVAANTGSTAPMWAPSTQPPQLRSSVSNSARRGSCFVHASGPPPARPSPFPLPSPSLPPSRPLLPEVPIASARTARKWASYSRATATASAAASEATASTSSSVSPSSWTASRTASAASTPAATAAGVSSSPVRASSPSAHSAASRGTASSASSPTRSPASPWPPAKRPPPDRVAALSESDAEVDTAAVDAARCRSTCNKAPVGRGSSAPVHSSTLCRERTSKWTDSRIFQVTRQLMRGGCCRG